MAIWAIGDIHGHSKHFKQLLDFIPLAPSDAIVLLGALISRGPDSAVVLLNNHKLK